MDAQKNLAVGSIKVAPVPAISGTSLTLATGHGARFPAPPFNATVWPVGPIPDPSNAEIVRVTALVGDVATITRAQESTSAKAITGRYLIAATITEKTFTDLISMLTQVGGSAKVVAGATLPAFPAGTEYVWNKTDGSGVLLDIISGVAT